MEHFDLAAAGLRADGKDLEQGVEVLARKLELALPGACRVRRKRRGLLSSERRVSEIAVDIGTSHLSLRWAGADLVGRRTSRIHDMRARTERLTLAEWLRAVEEELREAAKRSEEAREALDRLLHGE